MDIRAVEVEGEALCPCGSKKQYKDCCAVRGCRYALLEYEGKRILFDVDETVRYVKTLERFCSDNIMKPSLEQGAGIDKEKALKDLKMIFELTDKALQPFLRSSSCKKGCNACCYLVVDSTAIEAEMVRRYTEEHFDEEERRRILGKIKEGKHLYPDPVGTDKEFPGAVVEKHFALNMPCPFLSSEGLCRIYEVRPINCRKHVVFSDPGQCEMMAATASYEAEYFMEVDPAVNCLSVLVYPQFNHNRHFPDWFAEEFELL